MKTRTEYQRRSAQQIELEALRDKIMEVLDIADRIKEDTVSYDLMELIQKLAEMEEQVDEMSRRR